MAIFDYLFPAETIAVNGFIIFFFNYLALPRVIPTNLLLQIIFFQNLIFPLTRKCGDVIHL